MTAPRQITDLETSDSTQVTDSAAVDSDQAASDPEHNADVRIADLARLTPLDYEQQRRQAAKALGIRATVLDGLVANQRPALARQEADPFEDVQPWGEAVDGAALLSELEAAILRFCVLPDHSASIIAAWTMHAWAHDAADISPVLGIVSPEKRCGKTTTISVIGALVPKAMHSVNVTTSVLFRVIEAYAPTVLIDEGDTFLADNDELRGMSRISAHETDRGIS